MADTILSNTGIRYTITGSSLSALLFILDTNIVSSYGDVQITLFSKRHLVITIDLPRHRQSVKYGPHQWIKGISEDVAAFIKRLIVKTLF